jgi:5'-deoxynucleotidase YfbR-like HD superfamily hydrolase
MISPVKAAVGPGYEELDERLAAAIHRKFGLPAKIPVQIKKQIKKADKLSAWMEATQIAGFSEEEAKKLFGPVPDAIIRDLEIKLRPAPEVSAEFVRLHESLLS